MTSLMKAQFILQELAQLNVQNIILCPGGRNAPFVQLLSEPTVFKVQTFFDERAAGFYALGLSQKYERPVAVIVTSGTAVAELLPAVLEAEYTQTPLLIISADRPKRLRKTGSPQTIDQISFLKNDVELSLDLEDSENFKPLPSLSLRRPVHINVCLEEPLTARETSHVLFKGARCEPQQISLAKWNGVSMSPSNKEEALAVYQAFCQKTKSPLLLLSSLRSSEIPLVKKFLQTWRGLVYAEAPSGLREVVAPGSLISSDRMMSLAFQENWIDGVVRIGGVPTARFWRDMETNRCPVLSFSSLPFPGLSRGDFFHCEMSFLEQLPVSYFNIASHSALQKDKELFEKIEMLLKKYPLSEPNCMAQISKKIPKDHLVYVGNSLPLREWDQFASRHQSVAVRANRGVNGIDGQLSSALALADGGQPLTVIVGDLTALYDLNSLWAYAQNQTVQIFIINNQGGRIFERLFKMPLFYNQHQIDFSGWAQMWGLKYYRWPWPVWPESSAFIAEVLPDAQQTHSFWEEYDQLWRH